MEQATYPIEDVKTPVLVSALRVVIEKGLAATEDSAGLLPDLKSVYARAVVPSDRRSRLSALNELLPRLIATISDSKYREAVQILMALAPGTRGTTLTARRRQAAEVLGYNADHFRTRIEVELLGSIANLIYDDLLRYRGRVKRASESLEPTGDSPRLGPDQLIHEEELVSRIWQRVYGLRAELIAFGRLSNVEGYEDQAEDHRQAAMREEAELRSLLGEYKSTYGNALIRHGDAEYAPEALQRLADWSL